MLRMRLKRVGRKHDPSFRIVVTEKSRGPKSGRYVENLGSYDPRSDEVKLKKDRAAYWISQGVQPSETVHNILIDEGVIEGEKVNPLPQKSPVVSETEDSSEEETDAEEPEDEDAVPEDNEEESEDEESDEPEEAENEESKEETE